LRSPITSLWRAPGVLQIGLDAPAVVLDGVPAQLRDALRLLTSPKSVAELAALLPKLDARWLGWLVARLDDAGLLAFESAAPPEPRVTVVGAGPLAEAVRAALASPDVSVGGLDHAAYFGGSLEADGTPDDVLTVVAAANSEPDRTLTDALFRSGRAHLVVRLESDRAVVGPLVVPGRTPCVRCLDLTRCHLDADWPRLLAQLCLEATEPEPSLVTWAAATAMAQVRAWTAGRMPETGGGSLELALPNYLLTARRWPAHPRCGCLQPLG